MHIYYAGQKAWHLDRRQLVVTFFGWLCILKSYSQLWPRSNGSYSSEIWRTTGLESFDVLAWSQPQWPQRNRQLGWALRALSAPSRSLAETIKVAISWQRHELSSPESWHRIKIKLQQIFSIRFLAPPSTSIHHKVNKCHYYSIFDFVNMILSDGVYINLIFLCYSSFIFCPV